MNEVELAYIDSARDFAAIAHKNQKRSDGKPYFSHLDAVASKVAQNWETLTTTLNRGFRTHSIKSNTIAAAYLHDSIEDQGVTPSNLLARGFNQSTIDIIQAVTKLPNETYFNFITRLLNLSNEGATIVKLMDLEHNMSDLSEGSLKDKYRFAQHILMRS